MRATWVRDCRSGVTVPDLSTVMSLRRIALPLVTMFTMSSAYAESPRWIEQIAFWRTAEVDTLRREIETIEGQLVTLPTVANINSGERIGFRTAGIRPGEQPWIEIELPAATQLDRVVLVPMLAKGIEEQIPWFGFPRRFILEGFTDDSDKPIILRDERDRSFQIRRVILYPQAFLLGSRYVAFGSRLLNYGAVGDLRCLACPS